MDIQQIKHDLRRDIQNVMSVLKMINDESIVNDPELKTLVEMSVSREEGIIQKLSILLDKNERGMA